VLRIMPTQLRASWLKRSFMGAAAVLLLVEVVVRTQWFWTLSTTSSAEGPLRLIGRVLENDPDPAAFVTGSSLMGTALAPRPVEEYAGTDGSPIVNIAIDGGVASDFLWSFAAFEGQIQNGDLLVIAVEPRSLDNKKSAIPGQPNRFRRYASLKQRLATGDLKQKLDLLVGWVWRTWDVRGQMRGYIDQIVTERRLTRSAATVDPIGRHIPGGTPKSGLTEAEITAHAHQLGGYRFVRGVQFDALVDLVRSAESHGLEVILVLPPATAIWHREVRVALGPEWQKWIDAVEEATGKNVETVPFDDPRCADYKQCFVDYGHMNETGSVAYSEAFFVWLSGKFPEIVQR